MNHTLISIVFMAMFCYTSKIFFESTKIPQTIYKRSTHPQKEEGTKKGMGNP